MMTTGVRIGIYEAMISIGFVMVITALSVPNIATALAIVMAASSGVAAGYQIGVSRRHEPRP